MRRRDFFKGTIAGGVVATIPIVDADDRLFGRPASIGLRDSVRENKLRLLMSKGEIPVEVWEDVVNFSTVWSAVSSNPAIAEEFYSNKNALLARMGFQEDFIEPRSVEERLLFVSQDPIVRKAGVDGDYSAYLGRLKDLGVFSAESTLRQRVEELMRQDGEALKRFISRSALVVEVGESYTSDLERLDDLLGQEWERIDDPSFKSRLSSPPATRLFVGAVAVAVVAVLVATYVMAGVNVAVGLNIAAAISLVTSLAVSGVRGSGGGGGGGGCPSCHAVDAGGNIDVMNAAIRVAQINGNNRFLFRSMRRKVRREVIACLYAAHEQGVIRLPRGQRKQVFDLMSKITYRMAGI